jgi:hypothetical protein
VSWGAIVLKSEYNIKQSISGLLVVYRMLTANVHILNITEQNRNFNTPARKYIS